MSASQGKRRFARIDRLPPYVFNITAELKLAARRRGEDIMDMSMGNPDGATPPHIVAKLTEVAQRPDTHGYSASKGAVISLTRDLAVKWAPHGITVNAIAPGYFPTRMTEGVFAKSLAQIEAEIPMGRVGRPGELKGAAIFLSSRASDYITGHVLVVDGGYSAW